MAVKWIDGCRHPGSEGIPFGRYRFRATMKEETLLGATLAGPGSSPASAPPDLQSSAGKRLRQFAELRGVSDDPLGGRGTRGGPDLDASPLERAVGREAVRHYERALARLRLRDREAVLGRLELQWPYEQLAEALDVANPKTARAVVIRAIGRLVAIMSR